MAYTLAARAIGLDEGSMVRASPVTVFLASCWAIVDPPSTIAPSVTLVFDTPEGVIQPCAIYTGWINGVAVNFEWMRKRPEAALHQVLDDLDSLPTVRVTR